MGDVIKLEGVRKRRAKTTSSFSSIIFCRDCLKKNCPDISEREGGVVAMLILIVNDNDEPFHAYITISVLDLKYIFSNAEGEKYVDLAKYARIYHISEGFEPKDNILSSFFTDGNCFTVNTLN